MMQGQPMMMQQPGQVIVVGQDQNSINNAARAKIEQRVTCCGCMDVPCGMTTLIIFEVFYVIGFLLTVMGMFAMGAVVKASNSGYGNTSYKLPTYYTSSKYSSGRYS